MQQKINYINALPDFLAMQRVSFCWFITQGLNEELALFSKIQDFSQNTEYIMFSEEYSLIKPPYSLLIARKYSGNYKAQLVIPIEVRNKTINSIRYQNQFPIITLPLMTTYATFIINGCERVIVSQIIRSPGIYFYEIAFGRGFGRFCGEIFLKPLQSKSGIDQKLHSSIFLMNQAFAARTSPN